MAGWRRAGDFPLFPLDLVALPHELIPLHIFEGRLKTMMNECLRAECEFGIVWLSDDSLREIGFDDVRPRHGAVLAYLNEAGVRPGELARQARRRKQTIGAILDDLERLGYISRRPDPQDRRAVLIVSTDRGVAFMRASDSIVGEIEACHAARIGAPASRVKHHLTVDHITRTRRVDMPREVSSSEVASFLMHGTRTAKAGHHDEQRPASRHTGVVRAGRRRARVHDRRCFGHRPQPTP